MMFLSTKMISVTRSSSSISISRGVVARSTSMMLRQNNNITPLQTCRSFASLKEGNLTNLKLLADYVQEQQPDEDNDGKKIKKLNKEQVHNVLRNCFEKMAEDLAKGNNVRISDFGTFTPVISEARTGRNPNTGEPLQIPQKTRVKFTQSVALKRTMNKVE